MNHTYHSRKNNSGVYSYAKSSSKIAKSPQKTEAKGTWRNEKAYNIGNNAEGIDPSQLNEAYKKVWEKVKKTKTFQTTFAEFLEDGKFKNHVIELVSAAWNSKEKGKTTYPSLNKDSQHHEAGLFGQEGGSKAVIRLNTSFIDYSDEGKRNSLVGLALAATIFHEFWHLKITKWAQKYNLQRYLEGSRVYKGEQHNIMAGTIKGTGKNPEKSFFDEIVGKNPKIKEIMDYASLKLKFLEEFKGEKLTDIEKAYHSWAGLHKSRIFQGKAYANRRDKTLTKFGKKFYNDDLKMSYKTGRQVKE